MVEQPQTAEGHCDIMVVTGHNDMVVPDGTPGLDNSRNAAAEGPLHIVAEGEKGIRPQTDSRDLTQPLPLLLSGQRLGPDGEELLPLALIQHIAALFSGHIEVNGVIPVSPANALLEGKAQHLGVVAQLPQIGLVARQPGAVDAALLAGAHADDLPSLGIAHRVGLGALQGDKAEEQVPLLDRKSVV